MGRKAHADYIAAGLVVLEELGGGPISTKTLVDVAKEKGLVPVEGEWVYHNFTRKLRGSPLFDTSVRGQIKLVEALHLEDALEVPPHEDPDYAGQGAEAEEE